MHLLYNYSATDRVGHDLKECRQGEMLLLNLKLLLDLFDLHVQRHGEGVEKRMQEHEESRGREA